MRAATHYWNGNYDAMAQTIVDHMPSAIRVAARESMDIITSVDDLKADPIFNFYRWHNVSEEVSAVATEASDRACVSLERLQEVVDKFRAHSRNDLASMKAQSDRVQHEVESMTTRYNAAVQLLTSEGFERAIANAERMVAAMQAIHALQTTKVSLAIFGDADLEVRNGG